VDVALTRPDATTTLAVKPIPTPIADSAHAGAGCGGADRKADSNAEIRSPAMVGAAEWAAREADARAIRDSGRRVRFAVKPAGPELGCPSTNGAMRVT
jgi:hypothetical protein